MSAAYRTMLQKLLDTLPNITPQGSTLGGFSNGANTTAVLLAGQDEFILRHFDSFFLIEGGFGPLNANILQKSAMKRCRFLVLRGDAPEDEHPGVRDPMNIRRVLLKARRGNFTSTLLPCAALATHCRHSMKCSSANGHEAKRFQSWKQNDAA